MKKYQKTRKKKYIDNDMVSILDYGRVVLERELIKEKISKLIKEIESNPDSSHLLYQLRQLIN